MSLKEQELLDYFWIKYRYKETTYIYTKDCLVDNPNVPSIINVKE